MKRFGLSIFVLCLTAAQGQDWTQWRGPGRDGQFSFTEPKSWPDKLSTKWKVAIGDGYASPLLAGGKILEFTRQGEDEVAMAIEPESGKGSVAAELCCALPTGAVGCPAREGAEIDAAGLSGTALYLRNIRNTFGVRCRYRKARMEEGIFEGFQRNLATVRDFDVPGGRRWHGCGIDRDQR